MTATAAAALFRQVSAYVLLVFGAAAVLFTIFPGAILALFAPGLDRPEALLGRVPLVCAALAIPLTAASGVTTAYLNANHRFLIAGCGTVVFNLCIVASLALGPDVVDQLTLLALGVLAGALARSAMQLAIIPRVTWQAITFGGVADRKFLHAFGAGILATGLALLAPIIIRAMASLIGTGAIAAFNYAQKLIELPMGILITAISTVALTRLSGLHAADRRIEAEQAAYLDLRRALLIAIAAALMGATFAGSFITLAFGGGAMDGAAIARVTDLTVIALAGLPFLAVSSIATASLNARLQTPTVLRTTGVSLLFLPFLALPGLWLGSEKLLMAAVVAFQAILAFGLAARAHFRIWGDASVFSQRMAKALLLSIAMSVLVLSLDRVLNLQGDLLRLMLGGVGFLVTAFFSIRILR